MSHYSGAFRGVLRTAPAPFGLHVVYVLLANKTEPVGALAVSLFFLISGTVLTYSFQAPHQGWAGAIVRRIIRLGLPMVVSVSLAAFCFALWPTAHLAASDLMGHDIWLAWNFNLHLRPGDFIREIFLSGMLFGHLRATLLPPGIGVRIGLLDIGNSYNPVIWTLHLEFWGSLLVLALVRLRARVRPWLHALLCGGLFLVLALHPLGLFIIGHGVAVFQARRENGRKRWYGLGWASLIAGLAVAIIQSTPGFVTKFFEAVAAYNVIPEHLDAQTFHMQYGAVMVFFGVMMLPLARRVLQSPPVQVLGRYSFSLYLVHYPVLLSLVCAIFVGLAPSGLDVAAACAAAAGLAVTMVLTWLFERLADAPAIALSRRVGMR